MKRIKYWMRRAGICSATKIILDGIAWAADVCRDWRMKWAFRAALAVIAVHILYWGTLGRTAPVFFSVSLPSEARAGDVVPVTAIWQDIDPYRECSIELNVNITPMGTNPKAGKERGVKPIEIWHYRMEPEQRTALAEHNISIIPDVIRIPASMPADGTMGDGQTTVSFVVRLSCGDSYSRLYWAPIKVEQELPIRILPAEITPQAQSNPMNPTRNATARYRRI